MSDARRTAGGIPRHQPHATMRGVHPRSPKGPGALANFKGSMSMYSRTACTYKRQSHKNVHRPRYNERPVRQNSTASKLHLNITIRQYPPPQKLGGSGGEDAGCTWRRSQTDRKIVVQAPALREIWRPIKDEETKEKTWKKAENDERKGTSMEDKTTLDTILRRKSRRNRDLRQSCGCTPCFGTLLDANFGLQSLYEHTPLSKHGGTVMGRLSNSNRVERRISETPTSFHRDRCGTSIVFNTSEDRWNSFRDATENFTLCTLHIGTCSATPVFSTSQIRVNLLPTARHGGTSTEDPDRAVGKMRRGETNRDKIDDAKNPRRQLLSLPEHRWSESGDLWAFQC